MGLTQIHLVGVYSIAVVYVVGLVFVSGDDIILQKKSESKLFEMNKDHFLRKRPFCNAFKGCGKKKKSDDSMATFVKPNSEAAITDIKMQILADAIRKGRREEWPEINRSYMNLPYDPIANLIEAYSKPPIMEWKKQILADAIREGRREWSESNRSERDREYFLEKRPFCNAFKGCGKKKKSDDSMATLVKPYPKPAILEMKWPFLGVAIPQGRRGEWSESDRSYTDKGHFPRTQRPDTITTLVELNSEPAIEELNRQILSEAKLLETIQEAEAEKDQRGQEMETGEDMSGR